ncbi:MAG: hypothetical protein MHM6MM_004605 [Cercozoa sp. M6MM]
MAPHSIDNLLHRASGAFAPPIEFGPELREQLDEKRVLVVGAGGLGCEILKDLALSGFKNIEVIDLDTIELSNLNRQFLFRKKDIGRPKSVVAAEFVMRRVKGVTIKAHHARIQAFPPKFYSSFDVVIAGLDNVAARRWLNSTLCDLAEFDEDGNVLPHSLIPLIDGGTEGFKGQARLILPFLTACFECGVRLLSPTRAFAQCTIASVPRQPEHCIAYAKQILWPRLTRLNPEDCDDYELAAEGEAANAPELDSDDVNHMTWLYKRAASRAAEFGIDGVTFSLTQQVVKNIIPAIASTNALVSAACASEALKFCTWCAFSVDNYFMFMGHAGTATQTFSMQPEPDCLVCSRKPFSVSCDLSLTTLHELRQHLCQQKDTSLKNPSVAKDTKMLYMSKLSSNPKVQERLQQSLASLELTNGTRITVTDPVLGKRPLTVVLHDETGVRIGQPTEN